MYGENTVEELYSGPGEEDEPKTEADFRRRVIEAVEEDGELLPRSNSGTYQHKCPYEELRVGLVETVDRIMLQMLLSGIFFHVIFQIRTR